MQRVALLMLLAAGCSPIPLPPPDAGLVVPPLDLTFLPLAPDGTRLLAEVADARLEVDPTTRDPLTALGACVDAATSCYAPGERDLATCVARTRSCETATPWTEPEACCPIACKDAFAVATTVGVAPRAAFEQVFFLSLDCFPGVRALLEAR